MSDAVPGSRLPLPLAVIAITGIVGHLLLWLDVPLHRAILPAALIGALAWTRPRPTGFGAWPVNAVVLVAALAIAVGSIATPDRSWDGFATWTLTARHLLNGDGLDAAYFADPAVYHAARGYPLLQPILLQQCMAWLGEQGGRLLFPSLWLALVHAVWSTLAVARVQGRLRAVATLGVVLIPMFTEPGHGGAESGFAEVLLALLLTYGARAMLTDCASIAACVGLLLPMTKNEGIVHLLVIAIVAAVAGRRRAAVGIAVGGALGLAIWIPLQQGLLHPGAQSAGVLAAALPALSPLLAIALGELVRARRTRYVSLTILALVPLGVGHAGGLFGAAVGDAAESVSSLSLNWPELPAIVAALGVHLVWVRKLGLSFVLLIAVVSLAVRGRRDECIRADLIAASPLIAMVAINAANIVLFIATRPPELTELFLREGMVRYLAQTAGVAWITIGVLAAGLATRADRASRPTAIR